MSTKYMSTNSKRWNKLWVFIFRGLSRFAPRNNHSYLTSKTEAFAFSNLILIVFVFLTLEFFRKRNGIRNVMRCAARRGATFFGAIISPLRGYVASWLIPW